MWSLLLGATVVLCGAGACELGESVEAKHPGNGQWLRAIVRPGNVPMGYLYVSWAAQPGYCSITRFQTYCDIPAYDVRTLQGRRCGPPPPTPTPNITGNTTTTTASTTKKGLSLAPKTQKTDDEKSKLLVFFAGVAACIVVPLAFCAVCVKVARTNTALNNRANAAEDGPPGWAIIEAAQKREGERDAWTAWAASGGGGQAPIAGGKQMAGARSTEKRSSLPNIHKAASSQHAYIAGISVPKVRVPQIVTH